MMRRTTRPHVVENGHLLLEDVGGFLTRFVAYPTPHAAVAHVLWIVHAHLMEAWESTARLAFLSPEPGSGKTRALEVTELLVPRPVETVNATPAYIFRKIADEAGPPTLLYDEVDALFGFGSKKPRENSEEIRALLNAGHRRGAVVGRCAVHGKTVVTEEIDAFCAVAVAGLGWLPDTLMSRSVVIRMRPRAPDETVEPYRRRLHEKDGKALRKRLDAWAEDIFDLVSGAWPALPSGIEDRNADVWEPLLAVADAAGGTWPALAREAAVALVKEGKDQTPSLGIRLLNDLREIFGEHDFLETFALLDMLKALEESPWDDLYKGKPLDARGLAQRLKAYGIKPAKRRAGREFQRGYHRADFEDAWSRYPTLPSEESATSATPDTDGLEAAETLGFCVADGVEGDPPHDVLSATSPYDGVADDPPHDGLSATKNARKSANVARVAGVAHSRGQRDPWEGEDGVADTAYLRRRGDRD